MSRPGARDGGNNTVNNSPDAVCTSVTSGTQTGKSSSSDATAAEGDTEQEDSSSSTRPALKIHQDIEHELSNFRKLWQRDISAGVDNRGVGGGGGGGVDDDDDRKRRSGRGDDDEDDSSRAGDLRDSENNRATEAAAAEEAELRARRWFLEGVEHEKCGRLLEAIKCYKKAVTLVPDIEFKVCDARGRQRRTDGDGDEGDDDDGSGGGSDDEGNDCVNNMDAFTDDEIDMDEDEAVGVDLILKLQRFITRTKAICRPARDQRTTHVSCLPTEIILYILRWVVSHDLDLRSLEMCSMVCRGFYVCCRDPEIWRLACLKVWGVNCGNLKNYESWRTMFLRRPRLNYNGCYISKTTYVRHGETSFQDHFYRPWHVVEYYRYFRFFPEGIVYMSTTPDPPASVTHLLKTRENRHPSLLTGHYRLQDDRVFIVLQREDLMNGRFRKRKTNLPLDLIEQTFHIELQVLSRKNRINNCLIWKRYCVTSLRGATETKTSFEVMSNKFPCLWFSRVKSYTSESERPLL